MTTRLDEALECSVVICATRSTVFRFFKDSRRFAEWWGEGSRIEGRPGGAVRIRYPDGTSASGTVQELVEDERIVFSYGYDAPGKPIAPGGSRVTVTLREHPEGTLLQLRHEVADAPTRDLHAQGWRYQLALFANVAARDQHRDLGALVDRYFALWAEPDAVRRLAVLDAIATEGVVFQDKFGSTRGRTDLNAHIGACQVHMPGVLLHREGSVRQCQGRALADWSASGAQGPSRGRGTSAFDLAPDGRIARVVGFWSG
jgi:uncharacterized protein YndB with AHSA1/START domain